MINSVLESDCKRFRNTAIWENFISKKWPADEKKTHSYKHCDYTHQNNEIKEKLSTNSFIYVSTIFEHQVNTCENLKNSTISKLNKPKTLFRHAQGCQRADALTGSINIIQNSIITVYEMKHQKSVNAKLGERTNWFSKVIEKILHYKFRES